MMTHTECLEYLATNPTLSFPKNDSYVETPELALYLMCEEYIWYEDGSCYPLPDYVGDALINWHKDMNANVG